ncbi:MAG: hypothetical protein NVSMB24_38290 [Mucilaginibacter sp.]
MPEHAPPFTEFPDEEQFRIMANTAPVMIWISNTEKLCYFFNKGWLEFTGRTLEQEYGNGWAEGVHPEDLDRCWNIYATNFDNRTPFKMEYRLRYFDGSYRWVLDNGVPRYEEKGEFAGYIGSCIDIQEIKDAQFLREEFISVASHELKTPLTTLGMAIQSIERIFFSDPSSTRLGMFIKSALSSYNKMNNLVKGLLQVTQLEGSQFEIHKQTFPLSKVIDDCSNTIKIGGTHELIVEGDKETAVYADPLRIDQVVTNIVNNAVKYAPKAKEIRLRIEQYGDQIKISVIDRGPGIPAEKAANIFKRYYRVNNSSNQASGLGLGLYISDEIIKKHGGEMGVESIEGEGSTFWFTLPV